MPSSTQLVRTVTGVPTVANFANMDGMPIVIDDSTGNAYVLVAGVVTLMNSVPTLSSITNALTGDVALNNVANYFTGPIVAQGTVGTWFASGTVTLSDPGGAAVFNLKLWDGTTVIASARHVTDSVNANAVSLSGYIIAPVGSIRISVQDVTFNTGLIRFNASGNSMDATLSAVRIA